MDLRPFLFIMKSGSAGFVVSVADQVISVSGLNDCFLGELVWYNRPDSSCTGIVVSIEDASKVQTVILTGDQSEVHVGSFVYRGKNFPCAPAGTSSLGKVITPLGSCLNQEDFAFSEYLHGSIVNTTFLSLEEEAPGIISRSPVKTPMLTGINVVDSLLPLGCGQRELIIGDKNTGKTTLGITSIINQQYNNNELNLKWRETENYIKLDKHSSFVPCIYVSIGQRRSEVYRIKNLFNKLNTLSYTCIVFTSADENPGIQHLSPYAGTRIGEWFRDKGYNSLVIYDDLTNHAFAYRQMSLLLRRPPGREAYPGDIFYVHSKLLERSSQMNKKNGAGSLTSLPVIETRGNDISAFIPTNVISITDGQIYLSSDLSSKGVRPSVEVGLSVSRVGGSAQTSIMKKISSKVKQSFVLYGNYKGVEKLGGLSDPLILSYIKRGRRINAYFVQNLYSVNKLHRQVVSLFHISNGLLDSVQERLVGCYFALLFNIKLGGYFLKKSSKKLYSYIFYLNAFEAFLKTHSLDFFEKTLNLWGSLYQKFFLNSITNRIQNKDDSFLNSIIKGTYFVF